MAGHTKFDDIRRERKPSADHDAKIAQLKRAYQSIIEAEAMREGYLATAGERDELCEDWVPVDLEDWPE